MSHKSDIILILNNQNPPFPERSRREQLMQQNSGTGFGFAQPPETTPRSLSGAEGNN